MVFFWGGGGANSSEVWINSDYICMNEEMSNIKRRLLGCSMWFPGCSW